MTFIQKKLSSHIAAGILGISLSGMAVGAGQVADSIAPELSNAWLNKELVKSNHFMVAAANPIATQAGYKVLSEGGSAIDALVAVQMMLGLVEPQSSGLGGGAFVVYYDAKTQKLTTFDGRETAGLINVQFASSFLIKPFNNSNR